MRPHFIMSSQSGTEVKESQPVTSLGCSFIVDLGGRITQWSDEAAALVGLPKERALGRMCRETVHGAVPGEAHSAQPCTAIRALEQGRISGSSLLRVEQKNPAARQLRCELTALPSPPGGAIARLSPVKCRRSNGNGRWYRETLPHPGVAPDLMRDLCALAKLTTSLSTASAEHSLAMALEIVREATGAEASEVFLAEPGALGMVLSGHCGLFRNAFFQITRFGPAEGFPGLVLESHQPILTTALHEDPRYLRTRVIERGFRSFLSVPFFGPKGLMGSLNVAYRRPDPDMEGALRLLSWAGSSLSLMLQAQLVPAPGEIDLAGNGATGHGDSLDELLGRVLRLALRSGYGHAGSISMLQPSAGGVYRHLSEGETYRAPCPSLEPGGPANCPALSSNRGVTLYGPRRSWPQACQRSPRHGAVSYCLPMIAARQPFGIMHIGYRSPGPRPPTQHLVKLLTLAEQAALTVRGTVSSLLEQQRIDQLRLQRLQVELGGPGPSAPAPAHGSCEAAGLATAQPDSGPYLDIHCFGRFELFRQGKLVTPDMTPRRKALTLLKILLTFEGRPVPKDTLIELLWPEAPPDLAVGRLYMIVHALRRLLEKPECEGKWVFIRMDGDSYFFNVAAPCRIDVKEFRDLVKIGRKADVAGDARAAIGAYEAAVQLYRGDYLEDEAFTDWCWSEREHLRESCLDSLASLATHYARLGLLDRSIASYRQALRLDPAREQNHQGLIRALFASGRRDEALRQYHTCREVLRRELDIPPLPETESLYLKIRSSSTDQGMTQAACSTRGLSPQATTHVS